MTMGWRKCLGGYTLILVLGVAAGCGGPESDLISVTSPKGLYEVRVHGDFNLPTRMFTSHKVRLEVLRQGKRDTEPIIIHHADLLDTAFSERYHSPSWLSEQVLRFKSGVADTTAVHKLKVHNFEPAQPEPSGAKHYVLEVTIMPDHSALAVYLPNGEAARRLGEYNR